MAEFEEQKALATHDEDLDAARIDPAAVDDGEPVNRRMRKTCGINADAATAAAAAADDDMMIVTFLHPIQSQKKSQPACLTMLLM